MTLPTLVVISGPPGAGKTTLAHALAKAVCCPAICRDEIKEGMVHSRPGYKASLGDPLTSQASTTFFAVLDVLIDARVTLVAEAAFQDRVWRPALERLIDRAEVRVIRCILDPDIAMERIRKRLADDIVSRSAHADVSLHRESQAGHDSAVAFVPISLDLPTIQVDTRAGYRPGLDQIAAFARAR